MQTNKPRPRPALSCLPALAALGLLAACEADRYPVGEGPPQGAGVRTPEEKPPVPPAVPPPPATPPAAAPSCQLAGAPMPTRPLAISAFQLAERLSRFVWAAPADTAFLQKVTQLAPATSTDVGSLTREMLDDPRADAGVRAFYRRWLALSDQPALAPGLEPAAWTSMLRETDELVSYLTRYGGSFPDLLQVRFSFLDGRLAQHYGVSGVSGAELRRVDLDPEQRGGLLTHASWLGSHPKATQRGRWINGALYCRPMPAPPSGDIHIETLPEMPLTARERLEMLTAQAVCQGCHLLLDPPGFLYEHYDVIGRYRTSDNGRTVNARARVQLPGFEGQLDAAPGLAATAAGGCEAQACFARNWLAAATGIQDGEQQAAVDELTAAFRAARLSLRDLIVAVTQSRLFLQP